MRYYVVPPEITSHNKKIHMLSQMQIRWTTFGAEIIIIKQYSKEAVTWNSREKSVGFSLKLTLKSCIEADTEKLSTHWVVQT